MCRFLARTYNDTSMKLDFLEKFCHPIYIVGGAARDYLLGVISNDIDLTSCLTPEQFKKKCQSLGYKTFDTGLEHGTVLFCVEGEYYEHTTFRYDVSCDGRRATISYAKTIEEDLSRRDFTINAMAFLDGDLVDPFGGKQDLENRVIRTVGKAEQRFCEDYLRIIRAARFASKLNFSLSEDLVDSARDLSKHIPEFVAIERVMQELEKTQKNPVDFFKYAEKLGFLDFVFGFVRKFEQEKFYRSLKESRTLFLDEFFVRVFYLIEDDIESVCRFFRMSNKLRKLICYVNSYYLELQNPQLSIERFYFIYQKFPYGFDVLWRLLEQVYHIEPKLYELLKKVKQVYKEPIVNGEKLISWGLAPNKKFKSLLEKSIVWQIEGFCEQEIKEKILAFAISGK